MSRTALHNSVRINLHSTMFIFILSRFIFCVRFGLHLHSTMFIFIFAGGSLHIVVDFIYIPLCLYLYRNLCIVHLMLDAFTFHYVYIYMERHCNE